MGTPQILQGYGEGQIGIRVCRGPKMNRREFMQATFKMLAITTLSTRATRATRATIKEPSAKVCVVDYREKLIRFSSLRVVDGLPVGVILATMYGVRRDDPNVEVFINNQMCSRDRRLKNGDWVLIGPSKDTAYRQERT